MQSHDQGTLNHQESNTNPTTNAKTQNRRGSTAGESADQNLGKEEAYDKLEVPKTDPHFISYTERANMLKNSRLQSSFSSV